MMTAVYSTLQFMAMVIVFTVIISFINSYTEAFIITGLGNFGRILFSFIGTPVHEASHALMCLVFMHKIEDIKFLILNPNSSAAGYVYHRYNPKSLYQRVGNFFIGLAPVFCGFTLVYLIYSNFMTNPKTLAFWAAFLVCSQIIIHMRCSRADMENCLSGILVFTMLVLLFSIVNPEVMSEVNAAFFQLGTIITSLSAVNWLLFCILYRALFAKK